MNVLIIEDDPMVEFIHRSYLEKLALFENIYSADTVVEAQKRLAEKQVDLILLDIHLKEGNGLDFLTQLLNVSSKVSSCFRRKNASWIRKRSTRIRLTACLIQRNQGEYL